MPMFEFSIETVANDERPHALTTVDIGENAKGLSSHFPVHLHNPLHAGQGTMMDRRSQPRIGLTRHTKCHI